MLSLSHSLFPSGSLSVSRSLFLSPTFSLSIPFSPSQKPKASRLFPAASLQDYQPSKSRLHGPSQQEFHSLFLSFTAHTFTRSFQGLAAKAYEFENLQVPTIYHVGKRFGDDKNSNTANDAHSSDSESNGHRDKRQKNDHTTMETTTGQQFQIGLGGGQMDELSEIGSALSTVTKSMRHQWVAFEDENLVSSLHQMWVSGTWKCDTGFKAGYLQHLEKLMIEKLPGSGIKATPHIESRLKTLKKTTMAIYEMVNYGSGIVWSEEDKKVVVYDKVVFDSWVKSHLAARGLCNKYFPHYDQLVEIFVKDKENGKGTTILGVEKENLDGDKGSAAGKEVAQAIQKIKGLSMQEVMLAGKTIAGDSFMFNMFLSLSPKKRKEMVMEVLKK